jgi:hypothetical protein
MEEFKCLLANAADGECPQCAAHSALSSAPSRNGTVAPEKSSLDAKTSGREKRALAPRYFRSAPSAVSSAALARRSRQPAAAPPSRPAILRHRVRPRDVEGGVAGVTSLRPLGNSIGSENR